MLPKLTRHLRGIEGVDLTAWREGDEAVVAAAEGSAVRAARLLGAGEARRRVGGGVLQPGEAAARAEALAMIRHQLDPAAVEDAVAEGRTLGLEEVAREAIDGAPSL